jgi:hypothetical protein
VTRFLVGTLLGPGGRFTQREACGTISLYRQQAHVPVWRDHNPDLRPVGRVFYIEADDRGVRIVATVNDPTFDLEREERRYLSASFPDRCPPVPVGSPLRYENVVLREVSLVERPGADVSPVQLAVLDPRLHRGGYPHDLIHAYRQVLTRCYDHHARGGIRPLVDVVDFTTRRRTATTSARLTRQASPANSPPFADDTPIPIRYTADGHRLHVRRNVGYITKVG